MTVNEATWRTIFAIGNVTIGSRHWKGNTVSQAPPWSLTILKGMVNGGWKGVDDGLFMDGQGRCWPHHTHLAVFMSVFLSSLLVGPYTKGQFIDDEGY